MCVYMCGSSRSGSRRLKLPLLGTTREHLPRFCTQERWPGRARLEMEHGRRRSYQVCGHAGCRNWIWDDRVREGCVCRQCGSAWTKPQQGYAARSPAPRAHPRWKINKSVTPPPGLWRGSGKTAKIQKQTGDLLLSSWNKLDATLQGKLKELGISPPQEDREPDLEAVLKGNLSQLPAPVKELVEKITKPQPPTEKDVATKLKQQVSTLRDLSHRKQNLQTKIDATKKAFQDLLEEMKSIQSKIAQEQAELNTTSTAYMSLVSKQPDPVQLSEDADMKDPVPEAVAGFISTLGVNLTQAQHDQLKTMLERPPATNEEDPKRRKKADEEKDQSCG